MTFTFLCGMLIGGVVMLVVIVALVVAALWIGAQ